MKKKLLLLSFVALYGLNAQQSNSEKSARTWINEHAAEMNIKSDGDFKLSFNRNSLSGETLRFDQYIQNVPVYQSEIVVHLNPKGQVTHTTNSLKTNQVQFNVQPSISEENALQIALIKLNGTQITDQNSKLYVIDVDHELKLAYRIVLHDYNISGVWETMVDAQTGAIISFKDIAFYYGHKSKNDGPGDGPGDGVLINAEPNNTEEIVSGTAYIFDPDPLSFNQVAYSGNYRDNNNQTNAELDASRVLVNLPEITFANNTYTLKSTYAEIKNIEAPTTGLFTQDSPNFLFDRSQRGFEAANAFYFIDNSLRYINETLEIPCVSLQHNGVLWFDPHGQYGDDNSYYSSGNLVFGEGGVDDAEDADVILHELGHGLHDWITNGQLSQVNGLSEGSGDYWAQSYSRSKNQWQSNQAAYNWVFSWDGHNEFWSGRTTNYSPNYPNFVNIIHTDGQIWSTALMKIWNVLGRVKTDKIFLEGLSYTTSNTNQQNAAIAVRQAAIDMNYSCEDVQTITTQFQSKGYVLPALPLTLNCPGNQIVGTGTSSTYSLEDFTSQSNAIAANCQVELNQTPAVGTALQPGEYTITINASTADASTSCTFNLLVQEGLGIADATKYARIYPNPSKDFVYIEKEYKTAEKVDVYNTLGQKMGTYTIDANNQKINVSKLNKGVYILSFPSSKYTFKFIKE